MVHRFFLACSAPTQAALPFIHAVELERAAIRGDFAQGLPHLWWVLGYAAAVALFLRQMRR